MSDENGIHGAYITLVIQRGDKFEVNALVHYRRIRYINKMLTQKQASVSYTQADGLGDDTGVSMCSFDDVYNWLIDFAVNDEPWL